VPTEALRNWIGEADRLPLIKPGATADLDMPVNSYTLGVWIGDGSRHHEAVSPGTAMTISLNDTSKTGVVDELLAAGGHIVRSQSTGHSVTVALHIAKAIEHYGLRFVGSPKRFLPTEVLRRASPGQRRALLAGLMDTDGLITGNGSVQFSTASPQLADDVGELVRSLGGWAKTWRSPRPAHYIKSDGQRVETVNHAYRVSMRVPFNPFRHNNTGLAGWKPPGRTQSIPKFVTAVIPDGAEKVQCITVDSPDSLFLTRSLTPTHNSKSRTRMTDHRRHGAGPVYRSQAHLYGYGWARQGYHVNTVMNIYYPRDGELADAFYWAEPYNESIAVAALTRANRLHALGTLLGADLAMEQFPLCTGEFCRFCGRFRRPFNAPKTTQTTLAALMKEAR
jgi:hypothetical protein